MSKLRVLALAWWLLWNPATFQDYGGVAGPFETEAKCLKVMAAYKAMFVISPAWVKCVSDA